jgi:hypothetical protein
MPGTDTVALAKERFSGQEAGSIEVVSLVRSLWFIGT